MPEHTIPSPITHPDATSPKRSSGGLVIMSNRLPISITYDSDGTPRASRSSGGLVAGLQPLHAKTGGPWIGWDGATCQQNPACAQLIAQENCIAVPLSEQDVNDYYEGFSNSTLWPLLHGFQNLTNFDESTWEAYQRVNERFAQTALDALEPNAILWVHDFHLMLVPEIVRRARPDVSIGFFLHTPFPAFEEFRTLPWREEIIRGVIACDLVGFHTRIYADRFLECCQRIIGGSIREQGFLLQGRLTNVDVFPLGIDYDAFARTAEGIRAKAHDEKPESVGKADAANVTPPRPAPAATPTKAREKSGMKNMLCVGRLDYTKGIPELLGAYEELLRERPEWHGRVTLTLLAVPSREDVAAYRDLKDEVDRLVGSINGEFATLDWTPVRYLYRSVSHEHLVKLYSQSDVMLVTPLRDGMNLVCKEYLACRGEGGVCGGVLVLSEAAGAALELGEALVVNPFDRISMAECMHRALTMPADEQHLRMSALQRTVRDNTPEKWAKRFMASLDAAKASHRSAPAPLASEVAANMARAFSRAERRLLLLDYDGTLVELRKTPEEATPAADILSILSRLSVDARNTVTIISGRDCATLEAWFAHIPVHLVAEHGAYVYDRTNKQWMAVQPEQTSRSSWTKDVRTIMDEFSQLLPGSRVEEKASTIAWHYRACDPKQAEKCAALLRQALVNLPEITQLDILDGSCVIEVRPHGIDKGRAALTWLSDESYEFALVAGDDTTDEDMFLAADRTTWTCKVGDGATHARFRLDTPGDLRSLLKTLAAADMDEETA